MERRQATEVVGPAERHQSSALPQPSAQRCQKDFARTDAAATPAWHSTRSSELLESEDIIGFCGCVENSRRMISLHQLAPQSKTQSSKVAATSTAQSSRQLRPTRSHSGLRRCSRPVVSRRRAMELGDH